MTLHTPNSLFSFLAAEQPFFAAFLNASSHSRTPIAVSASSLLSSPVSRLPHLKEVAPLPVKQNSPLEQHSVGVGCDLLKALYREVLQFNRRHRCSLTTAQVCEQFILPRTAQSRCAYYQLFLSHCSNGRPWIAPATVFVSHAWKYPFVAVAQVLLSFSRELVESGKPQPYFWFDLFTNNQHDSAALPQEWWATTFRKQIGSIGTTLLVLMPWNDPLPLRRAWCLWEILCSIQEKSTFCIRLHDHERQSFQKALLHNFHDILSIVVSIDSSKAEAWRSQDKEMIFAAIEQSVSFTTLNAMVKDHLRLWILESGEQYMARLCDNRRVTPLSLSPLLASCSVSLGAVSAQHGKYHRAVELYQQALHFYQRSGDVKGQSVAWLNLGLTYGNLGKPEEVVTCLTNALSLGQRKLADKANCSIALGNAQLDLGRPKEALEKFQQALASLRELHSQKPTTTIAFAHSNIGVAYLALKNYGKAGEHYLTALRISENLEGLTHPNTADAIHGLAVAYLHSGKEKEAAELEKRAVAIYRENYGEDHPFTKQAQSTLCASLKQAGDALSTAFTTAGGPSFFKHCRRYSESEGDEAVSLSSLQSSSDDGASRQPLSEAAEEQEPPLSSFTAVNDSPSFAHCRRYSESEGGDTLSSGSVESLSDVDSPPSLAAQVEAEEHGQMANEPDDANLAAQTAKPRFYHSRRHSVYSLPEPCYEGIQDGSCVE